MRTAVDPRVSRKEPFRQIWCVELKRTGGFNKHEKGRWDIGDCLSFRGLGLAFRVQKRLSPTLLASAGSPAVEVCGSETPKGRWDVGEG